MANHVLKPGGHATWYVTTSGDSWTVKRNVDFQVYNGDGISDTSALHNSRFQIAGHITALDGEGLDMYGRNNTIVVAGSGFIQTAHGYGVAFEQTAYNGTLENHGRITSDFSGVGMTGKSPVSGHQSTAEIINYGRITGGEQIGIYSNSDDLRIVNKHGGFIGGGQYGYGITSVENDVTLINNGTIKGNFQGAIGLGTGTDSVTNSGAIIGDIKLGDGNDTFINRGGTVTGIVNGGVGADTYIVDSRALHLQEDGFSSQDIDTVKSSVSWVLGDNFEKLVLTGSRAINGRGNDQANMINYNAKSNVLTGMCGDEILSGGPGADHFVFAAGSGHDTITDFTDGKDKIDLRTYAGIDSFKDIAGIADDHGHAVITLANADTIDLSGVTAAHISAADFIFG